MGAKVGVVLAALAGAAGFAPAQPIGHDCVLWLRADQSVTTDGNGRVTGVMDGSGAGHDATGPGGNGGPLLVANAVGGKPAMRFSGGQWLQLAGQVLTNQRFTIVCVVNDVRTEGSFHEVFSNWTHSNTLSSVFFGTTAFDPAGAGTTRARLTDDVGGANQGQTGVGVIADRASHFIFTGISRSSNAEIYQNRELVAGRDTPITTRNLNPPYVLGRQGPISEFWTGDIAEILVYNTDLTRCELDSVYDYLNGKYGLAPCTPVITQQPAGSPTCPGGTASYTIQASGGLCDGNFTYVWRRDAVPLLDGPTGTGSEIAGASSPTLTISLASESDEGVYDCVVTNACGERTSEGAVLAICYGEFNCDGGIDGADVSDFFAAWENGLFSADVNQDGGVDGADVEFFFDKWENGC